MVASKWKNADNEDTTCQYLFETIIVTGLFGITVKSPMQAWMSIGSSAVNIGTGAAATYLTGNPAMAMGAIMQEGKKGMNAYMDQPTFLENKRVQDLSSSAMATMEKYATTNAYELENQKIQLEESIQNTVDAQAKGIPVDKRVLSQQRQALNRVMAQLADIDSQKTKHKAGYEKGMDYYRQAKEMERNVILNPANNIGDFAEDAAYMYGETRQKRALTEGEKSIISNVHKGTNIASGITDAFAKDMSAEIVGSAVSTYAGSRYQGQNHSQAQRKAEEALKSKALSIAESRVNALKDAGSEACTYLPNKDWMMNLLSKKKKGSEGKGKYSGDTAFMRYGKYQKEEEKQETPEEKKEDEEEDDDDEDYEEEDDDDEEEATRIGVRQSKMYANRNTRVVQKRHSVEVVR